MRMTIDDEKRKELGDYIKAIMSDKDVGFNQLCLKSKISIKPLNEILYGRQQKINPFYLQKIAIALRIDYKELYKIAGYLSDDDFNEADILRKRVEELEQKLKECESINVHNITNHGNQVIGFNSVINSDNNMKKESDLDISDLSDERLGELKKFIKYLKASN